MRVYNTLSRQIEEFEPLDGKHVRMYTCGPTVYNFAHIGNYRAYIFEDLLRRYLKYSGFEVTQVMNLTDVDDKTIKGANDAAVSLSDYTAPYKEAFFSDLLILAIEPAEVYPAATDHISEMIAVIERLFERGYAYQSDDGSVYFNIGKFPDYGKLARIDREGMMAGARVAHDEYDKENVVDFALWKAWSEDDCNIVWDSPWGRGRPGWHIECTAMSMKYLGDSFDLHTGGIDNMFPHHENEIAQSEAATGKRFVKYWMHCGYLVVDGRKMSKSLGNFHTLRDLIDRGYTGRQIRYVLMSAHYRQELNFTFKALDAARASLERLDEFAGRLVDAGEAIGPSPDLCVTARERFRAALDEDLNSPEAFSALFDMVHAGNRAMDVGGLDAREEGHIVATLQDFDRVLGFLASEEDVPDEHVLKLVAARSEARAAKDWAESDRIRDELAALGWEVQDTPEGAKVKKVATFKC